VLPGAASGPHPGFIVPCEPKLRRIPPTGDRWLSEIKHDGYRVQAQLEGGRPRLFTRRGYDWTPRFAALAVAMTDLANDLVLDGEVIGQGETGGRLRRATGPAGFVIARIDRLFRRRLTRARPRPVRPMMQIVIDGSHGVVDAAGRRMLAGRGLALSRSTRRSRGAQTTRRQKLAVGV
jgi:hypothetical protein